MSPKFGIVLKWARSIGHHWFLLTFLMMTLYHIQNLPLDLHQWRQTQTLSTARNFLFGHWNILMPEIDINNNQPFVLLEFPIYQFILALIWKAFGFSYVIGRIYSIALILAASWMTGKIAETIIGRPIRIFSHILLALPMIVFWSRTFMIDNMVLFSVVGSVYSLLEIDRKKSRKPLGLFLFMLSLLLLIKPNIAVIPFCFCLHFFVTRPFLRRNWLWLCLSSVIALVLSAAWFMHAKSVNAANPHVYTSLGWDWFWGNPQQLTDPWSIKVILWRLLINSSGWIFLIGLVLSIFSKCARPIALISLLSALIYMLAAPNLNLIHSYYQLPLSFPIALTALLGLEEIVPRFPRRIFFATTFGLKFAAVLFCIWVLRVGWFEFEFLPSFSPYDEKQNHIAIDQINKFFEERQINNTTALVKNVAICEMRRVPWDPHSVLFLTNTRGFFFTLENCPAFLAQNSNDYDYVFLLRDSMSLSREALAFVDGKKRILIQQ